MTDEDHRNDPAHTSFLHRFFHDEDPKEGYGKLFRDKSIDSDVPMTRRTFHEGWVHLCNGLDPVRDGGMVPSILGMTGALAGRHEEPVTVVTPTPYRLGTTTLPDGVALLGPETDLRAYVRTAAPRGGPACRT